MMLQKNNERYTKIRYRWIVDGAATGWVRYGKYKDPKHCRNVYEKLVKREESFIEYTLAN